MRTTKRGLILAAGGALAAACQTVSAPQPAHLNALTPEVMTIIKSVLAEAMGRTRIDLGPADPTRDSTISVLPLPIGPYEGRSPSLPTLFDILTQGGRCYLRKQGEETMRELAGVACRAA